jgi:hypothetical protein
MGAPLILLLVIPRTNPLLQIFSEEPENIFSTVWHAVPTSVRAGMAQYSDWLRAGRQRSLGQEFSLLHVVQAGSGATQRPLQWVLGALSPGLKRPGREAHHSSPTSAEIKKT